MIDEVSELLDTALYKEIAAQAFYIVGQSKTQDPGAKALMQELAEAELQHSQWLKELKEKGVTEQDWHTEKVPDLMLSEYLTGGDTLEDATIQDVLLFAMKREHQAIEFYSKMAAAIKNETAKKLCERLIHEELKHKLKLETLYNDMLFSRED